MMNKLALAIIFLLFPMACSAQAEFSLSCENVIKIHIVEIEAEYWPVESKNGYFYLMWVLFTEGTGEKLIALREAAPYTKIQEEDGSVSQYKDIAIIAQGKKIKNAMPKMDFLFKKTIGIPLLLKEEAFSIAHDICPALVPEKVRTID